MLGPIHSSARSEAAQLHSLLFATEFVWRVLPCRSIVNGTWTCRQEAECFKRPDKHSHTRNGVQDASADPDTILVWFNRWTSANVAIATDRGLLVVDVDPHNGGHESLEKLKQPIAATPIQGATNAN
jgi:Bifunctional DNA primase/polymerase, N-terminal